MNKTALLNAITLAQEGKWDEAHHIVQDFDDEVSCWIHAVLHKIEGDDSNSRYWFRRAGREFRSFVSPQEELKQICEALKSQ